MADWSESYKALLKSKFGEELVRTLTDDLASSLAQDARRAKTAEEAFGLIRESEGVIKAVAHLKMKAVSLKGGEESDN